MAGGSGDAGGSGERGPAQAVDPVRNHVPGQPRHRGRVLPPLAEGLLRLPHHRTPQLQLDVVVGGVGSVDGIGSHALPIATVIGVVAAAVVEVDAADERHIVLGTARMADDDHLLVVAAEREHPLVQQHLTARPVDGEGERPVRTDLRAHHAGVSVPQQPPHLRPTTGRPGQRLDDRRPAVGEELDRHRPATPRTGPSRRRPPRPGLSPRRRSTRVRAPAGGPCCPRSTPGGGWPHCRARTPRGTSPRPSPPAAGRSREPLAPTAGAPRRSVPRPGRHRRLLGTRDDRLIFGRSTSSTCRNAITATRSRRRCAKSTNTSRVVPAIVPEEHPAHVRHPVREMFDAGQLARPAAPDAPTAA